jgi:hypothetical protein
MLPTQWAELQARIRRYFRTVGQQAFNLDEVISPVGLLQNLDGAPWRSDPVAWYGQVAVTGAAAGNFNYWSAELNFPAGGGGAQGGCALVLQAAVYAREALAAAPTVGDALLTLGPAFNNGNGFLLCEPAQYNGFAYSVPVRGGTSVTGTVPTNHTTIARGPIYQLAAGAKYGHVWTLNPPILLADLPQNSAQACIAAGIALNDAGGAPVDIQASFQGLYFNLYPQR